MRARSSLPRLAKRLSTALWIAFALAPAFHAGDVLRVGPGQTFATIQAAVDAAGPGDYIEVQPGSYPRFTVTNKSLTIAPSGTAFAVTPAPGQPEITVQNVAAGKVVTIVGAAIAYDDPLAPAVRLADNDGAVRLSRLDVVQTSFLIDATVQASVEVDDTDTFWLIDSSIWPRTGEIQVGNTLVPRTANGIANDGISGLQLVDSQGVIQNSRMRGYLNDHTPVGYGGDGLRIVDMTSVWLVKDFGLGFPTIFSAGDGLLGGNAIHQFAAVPVTQRVTSCGGGNSTPTYRPGQGITRNGGIYGDNNTNGTFPLPPVGIAFRVPKHCVEGMRNENALESDVVPIGGVVTARVRTFRARRHLTIFSDTTRYDTSIQPFAGRGMLDASRILAYSIGRTAAETAEDVSLPVPAIPALIGLQLTVQSLTGPIGGAFDAVSAPALCVIGP